MAVEIEAKLKVASHEPIRQRLGAAGAERVGCVLETNTIFDSPDRTFLATDQGLRVRRIEVIDGPDRSATLTYKGPRTPDELKTRREVELSVSDAGAAVELLVALGFVTVLAFEKRRETWLAGGCHVELDELPRLGSYVEVEGPDSQAVRDVLTRLGLDGLPIVKESYIGLLIGHCRERGIAADRIVFAHDEAGNKAS
ncbi:MAG: class IV adenylate cyclase [Phycisphaerae bacterium]|nr:class IV adenylate cyclase [Phycisphaerae bacterium]